MSEIEHVKSQQLLIEWLGKCEHLTSEKWLLAVAYGSPEAADNDLAEIIWSYYDRGMIAGAAEIKRLREERDEARREVCKARAAISRNSWAAQAKKAGWDNLWEEA